VPDPILSCIDDGDAVYASVGLLLTFSNIYVYFTDEMNPDTESYNWVIQSFVRHKFGDRLTSGHDFEANQSSLLCEFPAFTVYFFLSIRVLCSDSCAWVLAQMPGGRRFAGRNG